MEHGDVLVWVWVCGAISVVRGAVWRSGVEWSGVGGNASICDVVTVSVLYNCTA